jgi:hypothetical protein
MFRISTASFSIQLMTQTPDQAVKAAKQQFRDEVVSHLNQVAPVTARAMFGGYGLYSEGTQRVTTHFSSIRINSLRK